MNNKNSSPPAPTKNHKTYHAFISHKNDCKPWVRTLAKNLSAQGFKVFLDENEIMSGRKWVPDLYRWLNNNDVGPYQPYLHDPLLKELYWKNLLQKDKKKICLAPFFPGIINS